ncbi:unnamed protein product [Gongylonema pulchrum]|uniref:Piwi domain-containing protein n=1 Tax=Gongylonema pulchrum TaxID=637853 RepID=A0A183EQ69_9BILA|nr:unnamed protein product [Gongylonema pulchrum]
MLMVKIMVHVYGTAKTPRYTVLIDDNDFTMDDLEGITYSLCFCHQIATLTTSVPTPLYVAGLYADRGRRMLYQWRLACFSFRDSLRGIHIWFSEFKLIQVFL